jgi:hypothetical protein
MSKISLAPDASGSGIFTIASPNSNTNRTLTLPDATGTVVISGTTPSLNGITFPATQVASADANTLDDYEEGTWTLSLGGTATYNYQNGYYRKIGSVVTISFIFQVDVIGTGSTQFISGLPFAGFSTPGAQGGGVFFVSGLALNFYSISCGLGWGSSTQLGFALQQELDGGTTLGNAAVFQNGARIDANLTYIAA